MLQETISRLDGLPDLSEPIVVCNTEHRFLVAEQLQQINIKNPVILLEPTPRNTAPAIAAAALYILKENKGNEALLLVLSADHVIQDLDAFYKSIHIASKQANSGRLVTFGIVPTEPNIGYGYIKSSLEEQQGAYMVESFVEKPDKQTAQKYLENGNYLWNSGMFMFNPLIFINELTTHSKEIVENVSQSIDNSIEDLDFIRIEKESFESSPSDSVDYALMEKSDNVVVVPLDAGWSDIGSWSALHDIGTKDHNGNIIQGDVFAEETINSYIHANHHMVATIGVKDLIIVDTPNATLISSKDKAHKVKKIVEQLQQQGREEQFCHRKVYRPWGWYDSIEAGKHFQVKRLHVNPGAKLSLQMHHKRAEHWVVICGVATAINGDETLTLKEGDSTFIPIGVIHSLENQDNTPLEIIEVQSGTYLGEDDIVRFEDIYGRIKE
jgi:mannose-1-phosphate guanylyltransferase/mannose-6-phosphate isomerase